MADAPGQGVLNRVRLLVNLFLHIVAINPLSPASYCRLDSISAIHFRAGFIENHHRTTGNFGNIALFEEDKAAGHRQQRQLVRSDKVFAHARPMTSGLPERAASSVPGSRVSMITVP